MALFRTAPIVNKGFLLTAESKRRRNQQGVHTYISTFDRCRTLEIGINERQRDNWVKKERLLCDNNFYNDLEDDGLDAFNAQDDTESYVQKV